MFNSLQPVSCMCFACVLPFLILNLLIFYMAVTQNPIIGRTRKSFGNVTFRHYHNNNIVTSKIQKRYKDSSTKQSNCNSIWSQLHSMCHDIIPFVSKSFSSKNKNTNSFNLFYKALYPCFQYNDNIIYPLDNSKIQISSGFPINLKVKSIFFNDFYYCNVKFILSPFYLSLLDKYFCKIIAFDASRLKFYDCYTINGNASGGLISFVLGTLQRFSIIDIFVCFVDYDFKIFSNTFYCGQIMQPYVLPINQVI